MSPESIDTNADARDPHAATPEFAAHLEWQIRTALRRSTRFTEPAAPAARASRWARARSAAVLVVALGIGAGGVLGAQEVGRRREAEILLARHDARRDLARARFAFAEEARQSVEVRARAGLASSGEREAAELRCIERRLDEQLAALDAAEIALAAAEPDDGLAAPLVRGRDFVSERAGARVEAASRRLAIAEEAGARARQAHERGFASDGVLDAAQRDLHGAIAELALHRRRIELRSAFREGEIDARAAELLAMRAEIETRNAQRGEALASAERAFARTAALAERGLASQAEVQSAELARIEAGAAVKLAELELGLIDERLRR